MGMTETNKTTGEKLSVASTKTLTLKRSGVEQGVVRQSFSHGRSKAVVVEKVKRRTIGPAEAKADAGAAPDRAGVQKQSSRPAKPDGAEAAPASGSAAPKSAGVVLRPLTREEMDARATALDKAERIEVEERKARRRQSRSCSHQESRRTEGARRSGGPQNSGRRSPRARTNNQKTGRRARPEAPRRRARPGKAGQRPTHGGRGRRSAAPAPRRRRRAGADPAPAEAPAHHRREAPRPPYARHRLCGRRSTRTLQSRVPPARSAPDRPARFRTEGEDRPRSDNPRDDHRAGSGQPHVGALRRRGAHADEARPHGDQHGHDRRRHRAGRRRRARPHGAKGLRSGRGRRHVRCYGRSGEAAAARAGGHHHGPRRSRQDVAARRHPLDRGRGRRSRRHHPAYRRLSGDLAFGRPHHLHRYARPCRVHRHARARRQDHRYRGAGGGRR